MSLAFSVAQLCRRHFAHLAQRFTSATSVIIELRDQLNLLVRALHLLQKAQLALTSIKVFLLYFFLATVHTFFAFYSDLPPSIWSIDLDLAQSQ